MNDEIDTDQTGAEWRQVINRAASAGQIAPAADEIEETPVDRIARMLATIGSGGRATVKLYRNRSGKREWCADYSPSAFEQGGLNLIREEWGPGEYEVVLYAERQLESGKSHYGVRARESIDIAAPRVAASTPAAPAMNGELLRMIDTIAQGQARMVELLAQRPAAPDPNAQMMQMMQMMKLAREAFAPADAPKSQVSEIVAAMRELRQAGEELNPRAEPSDPLTAALPGMINLIGQSMQARQALPAPQAFEPVALPASMAADPSQPAAQPEHQPEPADQAMAIATLRMHLSMLIDLAQKGAPIEEAATLVYDRAPDEIIDLLAFPNWFSMLEQFEPKVKPHAQWFSSVAARVAELLAADSDNQTEG